MRVGNIGENGHEPLVTRLAIIMPVFNDWTSFLRLVEELDQEAACWPHKVDIVAVDDGSTQAAPSKVEGLKHLREITLLGLAANLGHQRAIAVGIAYVHKLAIHDAAVIMDCDGEDRPADVSILLAAWHSQDVVVVAQRGERSEGAMFRLFYHVYKVIFRLLIGRELDFGNFCLVPRPQIARLVHMPELWNHLAATLLRAKTPTRRLKTTRGQRYAGHSSMNFVSLVVHGLSAVAVFADVLFVRLLVAALSVSACAVLAAIAAATVRAFTTAAIPGWATTIVGFAGVAVLQALTLCATAAFITLSMRSAVAFIPAVNALTFLRGIERIDSACRNATSIKDQN